MLYGMKAQAGWKGFVLLEQKTCSEATATLAMIVHVDGRCLSED